jgi:hypothetical protein
MHLEMSVSQHGFQPAWSGGCKYAFLFNGPPARPPNRRLAVGQLTFQWFGVVCAAWAAFVALGTRLNLPQRHVLLVAAIALLVTLFYPPWHPHGREHPAVEYSFLYDPPPGDFSDLAYGRLFLQWLVLGLVTFLGLVVLARRQE